MYPLIALCLSLNVLASDNLVQIKEETEYYQRSNLIQDYNPLDQSNYLVNGTKELIILMDL